VVRDANEIIAETHVFKNARQNTFAAFSDFLRYKLLLDRGGWWVDVDTICLRPFDFEDDYVFPRSTTCAAREPTRASSRHLRDLT
jgi:hypothetical protein